MIDVLEIDEKRKVAAPAAASPDDFASHKVGDATPSVVISDPTISLYCLDHAARRALFVQVPPEVDLTVAPFLYMAQYDHAQRLLAVPYDTFHHLAATIDLRVPLIFIYSTGRAGSTLLSKAFGEMGAVRSLSEPDVYELILALRVAGEPEDVIGELLTSATKMLFNAAASRGASLNVIKFRSECIQLADLLFASFPNAGTLFLYRDLAPFIRSGVRAFAFVLEDAEVRRGITANLAMVLPLLAQETKHRSDLDGVEIACFFWLTAMQSYVRLRHARIPILPVRYEELVANPSQMLETILAFLGLPTRGVPNALRAFERDSQAGSPLSREEAARQSGEINDQQWEAVRDLLRRYPVEGIGIPPASVSTP